MPGSVALSRHVASTLIMRRKTLLWTESRATSLIAAAAKSLQLCPTLCDPIDGRPPGSPILFPQYIQES